MEKKMGRGLETESSERRACARGQRGGKLASRAGA